jgi:hypothetical protein
LDAPPSATSNTTQGSSTFAGLLPQQLDDKDDQPAAPDFVIISKIVQKSRVQATTNNAGADFSQYHHGDYGEDDMDVDYTGQQEDEEEGDTNKEKKKKVESTLASRDYENATAQGHGGGGVVGATF